MRAAGKLKEVIEIYYNQPTKDGYGHEVENKTLRCSTRANVISNNGNRTLENDEITHIYTKSFKVRGYIEVNDYDFVKYEGKFYRVLDIDFDKEHQFKIINTEIEND